MRRSSQIPRGTSASRRLAQGLLVAALFLSGNAHATTLAPETESPRVGSPRIVAPSDNANHHRIRARERRAEGRFDDALAAYREVVRLDAHDADAWFWIGTLERWAGRPDEALRAYDRAVELSPDSPEARTGRARVHRTLGNERLAETDLRAALAVVPGNPDAMGLLADGIAERGEGRRAAGILRQVFEGAELHRRLGDTWRRAGQTTRAIAAYRNAVEADPADGGSLYWTGVLSARIGRTEEARAAYDRLLALRPGDAGAREGLDALLPDHAVEVTARSSRAQVIEGLEDEGLFLNGTPLSPVRVEYLTQSGSTRVRHAAASDGVMSASASWSREAVTNLDYGAAVYDFAVWRGAARFEGRRSDTVRWFVRAGGVRYDSRTATSVANEDHAQAGAGMTRTGRTGTLRAEWDFAPVIHRGFAGGFDFRIFDRHRIALSADRRLRRVTLSGSIGGDRYDSGVAVPRARFTVAHAFDSGRLALALRHDPFPARFLSEADLDIVNMDAMTLGGWIRLDPTLRLEGELLAARYGLTPRTVVVGSDLVEGPREHNTRRFLRAETQWRPGDGALVIHTGYRSDEYDFDTAPYNTNNLHGWTAGATLEGTSGPVTWMVRHTRGLTGDERNASYDASESTARLTASFARPRGAPVRMSVEATLHENQLGEETEAATASAVIPF
ncbi:MAG: tetratricopeptide repeat protein [Gemmatimonadota bacterium]|nr:hypothetical protein [Gemmatimonadota bacterium]MDP6530097.1 tetratricopeptide repeat protein [Gemmatimonadota bacterium]MDP7031323.1 tetratricopeptide repeat protein [Gemmatimonadota bacterium]